MRGLLAFGILFGAFNTAPAYADWQFTRWGMSQEDVKIASGNKVAPTVQPNSIYQLYGAYKGEIFEFRSDFFFIDGRYLDGVNLHPIKKNQCKALLHWLKLSYGLPVLETRFLSRLSYSWRDEHHQNQVSFETDDASDCDVSFSPLKVGGAPGNL